MCNVIKAAHRFRGYEETDEYGEGIIRDRDAERNEVGGPVGVVAALVVIAIGLLSLASWLIDCWRMAGL